MERRTNLGEPVLPEVVNNKARLSGRSTSFFPNLINEYPCDENINSLSQYSCAISSGNHKYVGEYLRINSLNNDLSISLLSKRGTALTLKDER